MLNQDELIRKYLSGKATSDEKDYLLSESLKAIHRIRVILKEYKHGGDRNDLW